MKPIHYIAGGLALALTVSVCDGLRLRDKTSVLIGREQEANKALQVIIVEKDKTIATQGQVIALKSKIIADILAQAGQPSPSEVEKDKVIAVLKKKNAELAASGDYKAAYEGAQAEIAAWSEKFTLAETRHAKDIFDINAAWAGKYDAQCVISESWKAQYEGANRVLIISQALVKSLTRKAKRTAIVSNIEKAGLGILGAYIVYDKIKGK